MKSVRSLKCCISQRLLTISKTVPSSNDCETAVNNSLVKNLRWSLNKYTIRIRFSFAYLFSWANLNHSVATFTVGPTWELGWLSCGWVALRESSVSFAAAPCHRLLCCCCLPPSSSSYRLILLVRSHRRRLNVHFKLWCIEMCMCVRMCVRINAFWKKKKKKTSEATNKVRF